MLRLSGVLRALGIPVPTRYGIQTAAGDRAWPPGHFRAAVAYGCFVLLGLAVVLVVAPAVAQEQNHEGLAVEWIYPTVGACGTVVTGDFDGDGDADLAVAEGDSQAISLWWNDGRARFEARGSLPVGHAYGAFVALDADGDGRQDLAVADPLPEGGIELFRGLGAGSFAPAIRMVPGLRCALLGTAEINGDARPDLVAGTASSPYRVMVLLQGTDGEFVPSSSLETERPMTALTVGDFDGDAVMDVACAVAPIGSNGAPLVRILRVDAGGGMDVLGSFTESRPREVTTLLSADLDGDGRLDLLSAHDGDGDYSWAHIHRNLGAGSFDTLPLNFNINDGGFRGALAAGDIDRDGRSEVLGTFGNRVLCNLVAFESVCDPLLRSSRSYSFVGLLDGSREFTAVRMLIADLDPDGHPDLIVLRRATRANSDDRVVIVRSRPQSGFGAIALHDMGRRDGMRAVHFAREGPAELVMFGSEGTFRVPVGRDGVPSETRRISDARAAWVLDADGDGRDDLALGFGGDSIGISLTGKDGESGPISSWLVGRWLAAGDLDGDHRPEIALARNGADYGEVLVAWNDRRGAFGRVTATGVWVDRYYGAITIDDVLGGGVGELVLFSSRVGNRWSHTPDTLSILRVLPNGHTRTLLHSLELVPGPRFKNLIAADVDGDRQKELVMLRSLSGEDGVLYVLRRSPDGGFIPDDVAYGFAWEEPQSLVLDDLDGDGDLDAVCESWQTGLGTGGGANLQIRWNDGTGRFNAVWRRYIALAGPSMISVADLDGDGISDIAAANPPLGRTSLGVLL